MTTSTDAVARSASPVRQSPTRRSQGGFASVAPVVHRGWFAAKDDGQLDPTIVRLIETPALSHALIKYRYTSKAAPGQTQTIVSWLALTFAMEHGRWRLVFDQNTLIQKP